MSPRLLFLLGGPAFDTVAEEFVPIAGGKNASIALLLFSGFKKAYLPDYIQPWKKKGVSRYHVVTPQEDGTIDVEATTAKIREATGIFIGGGPTQEYHRLYATEPIKKVIRECYDKCIPIAGLSAGALIIPEICVVGLGEKNDVPLQILDGLGLITNIIVGPHFTERNVLPFMLKAMSQVKVATGWGIDESACAVFENERFAGVIGKSVYEIIMTDFETKTNQIKEMTKLFSKYKGNN